MLGVPHQVVDRVATGDNERLMKNFTFVLVPAFLIAGCTPTLDMKKIEKKIEEMIEEQTSAKVDEVECPEKREIKDGDEFDCDIEFKGGGDGKVTVDQKGGGDVNMTLEPIVVKSKLEKEIEKGLKKQGSSKADVKCKGDEVRHFDEGDELTCKVETSEGEKKATVEFLDDEGKMKWRVE